MAMLFMVILYIRVTKPIIFLSKQVKTIGRGQFDVNLTSKRQDEFGGTLSGELAKWSRTYKIILNGPLC